MEKLRTLDLFSGIGGFSLGLDSTGYFETVAFCEIEAFPCKVLNKHWPDVPIYNDVKELSYEKLQADGIISRRRGIDVICGGYPCQPFSVAGRQGGEDDPRHLWPEYFRLIRELRPHYAIGENVGGHLRLGLDTVLEDLDSENYTVRCFSVEAASLGAPHRRERIFWIAMADSVSDEHRFEIGEGDGVPESLSRKHWQENSASREPIGTGAIRRTDNGHVSDTQFKGLEGRSRNNCGGGREVLSGIEHDGHSVRRQARRTGGEDGGTSGSSDNEVVPNTDSGVRRGGRTVGSSGEDSIRRIHTKEKEQAGDDLRGETLGRNAVRGETEDSTTDVADTQGQLGERSESEGNQRRQSETAPGDRSGDTRNVADTDDSRDRTPRRGTNGNREKTIEGRQEQSQSEPSGHSTGNATDTHSEGLEGTEKARNSEEERTLAEQFTARQGAQRSEEERRETTFESYLGGGNDGISAWLDGSWERGIPRVAPSNKMRVPRLKALGNAVLPQLVYMVGMAIVLSTKRSENEE